ncbi:molybdenum cofactor biosynthesis protein [Pluteus cervinus]|uniref:Molybdenum cofactor biosynthesis protein n=1 Tax=Pluteus cervinus TaxID=181527 RepID=A0ACD3AAU4_9AGAR|nr:molybdenum cofactor biosynthesis protein [Pluteus cervinus]
MSKDIRTAILTISDTASRDASADRSGPTIKEIVGSKPGFVCNEHLIVSDDISEIQQIVKRWTSTGEVDWIITTGGTGFGVRDTTPEAISPLLEREASGLVHLLLSSSIQHTPLAALSRPVAGTIKNTLIVTLPGSVKAVKENLDALFGSGVIEHALDLIKGGSGKQVHAALAAQGSGTSSLQTGGGHHHHHHHHGHDHHAPQPRSTLSHDPTAPVSARHRKSPYPIISLEDALTAIQQQIVPLEVQTLKVSPALMGHVLAVDVHAPQNVPSTSTTNVDGYAVRSTDPPGVYNVVTPQNHSLSKEVPPATIYRINTGAPLPAGTDAVIMVEDTRLVSTFDNEDGEEGEEKEVETLAQVPAGENVRYPGSDVKKGDLVLQKGEKIRSGGGEIGTLAFVGRKEVQVVKKPVVAILSTGNEIVDLQSSHPTAGSEEWGGIFDTNRPSLQAALEGFGYEVVDLGVVQDSIPAHLTAIQRGLDEADLILTTGGTSMGPSDLLKPVIERNFGGTVHFGRVSIKPGKPTTFATIATETRAKPIFALPGNPASALVTFHVFVLPALRQLGGWPIEQCQLPRVQVEIQVPMNLDPRNEFHRVVIRSSDGKLKAFSTGGQRSSRVASLNGANGFVLLPMKVDGGPARLEAGSVVDAVVIGELESL